MYTKHIGYKYMYISSIKKKDRRNKYESFNLHKTNVSNERE